MMFDPNKYLGRQIDLDGFPREQPFQCYDLANQYSLDIGGQRFTGLNASDIFGQQPGKYDWIRNTPGGVPSAGAVVVWDGGINNGPGHVAVATGNGNTNQFETADQNWNANRVTLNTHNYSHVIGWGVPKGASNMANYTEEKVNRGDITNIYREGILRDPNDNDFAAWEGKGWKQFTYDLVARGDFAKHRFEQADASFKQVYSQLQDSEKARADQLVEINDLKAKLATAGSGVDQQTKDQITETNSIVKQILKLITDLISKITAIFK